VIIIIEFPVLLKFFNYSFSFLWGPWNHMMHLISLERLPFTIAYVVSLVATLWAALGVSCVVMVMSSLLYPQAHSTILTLVFAVIQIGALVWLVNLPNE